MSYDRKPQVGDRLLSRRGKDLIVTRVMLKSIEADGAYGRIPLGHWWAEFVFADGSEAYTELVTLFDLETELRSQLDEASHKQRDAFIALAKAQGWETPR